MPEAQSAPASAETASVISVRKLRKSRRQGAGELYSMLVPSLEVAPGEKILISGPSGSGKSTLLDMLGMALRPDEAERFVFRLPQSPSAAAPAAAHDVARAWAGESMEDLAHWRRHVGYVLQTGGLLPFLTVRENILSQRRLLGLPLGGEAEALAARLGIERLLRKLPAELSVGERQRAAIARALAASPPLVLADEPTAALDPANAQGVLELFLQTTERLGAALIMASHSPEQTRGMGFRQLCVQIAPPDQGPAGEILAVLSALGAERSEAAS